MNKAQYAVFSALFGEKKIKIILHLISCADSKNLINQSIADICKECECSKPTAINTIKMLQEHKILQKVKNGLYKFNIEETRI